jgi:hypothetical protein
MSENLIIERKIFLQSKRHPERNIIMERDIYNNITFIENGIIENIPKQKFYDSIAKDQFENIKKSISILYSINFTKEQVKSAFDEVLK